MVTLQKLKLLATQCCVAPMASTDVQLSRGKTNQRMVVGLNTLRGDSLAQPVTPSNCSPPREEAKEKTESSLDNWKAAPGLPKSLLSVLQMLLRRTTSRLSPRRWDWQAQPVIASNSSPQKKKDLAATQEHTLEELFLSSSPPRKETEEIKTVGSIENGCIGHSLYDWRGGPTSPRPIRRGSRCRSLRKTWRSVMDTIPEEESLEEYLEPLEESLYSIEC